MVYLQSPRRVNLVLFGICLFSMACALYFELVLGLEPCPLCITQRLFMVLVGVLALIAALHNPGISGQRIYAVLTALAAVGGGFFSSRQLWLQQLSAEQVPVCGPPLGYLIDNFPLWETLQVLLRGDGHCAEVSWHFLGLSMPAWVLLIFVVLLLLSLWQLFIGKKAEAYKVRA